MVTSGRKTGVVILRLCVVVGCVAYQVPFFKFIFLVWTTHSLIQLISRSQHGNVELGSSFSKEIIVFLLLLSTTRFSSRLHLFERKQVIDCRRNNQVCVSLTLFQTLSGGGLCLVVICVWWWSVSGGDLCLICVWW